MSMSRKHYIALANEIETEVELLRRCPMNPAERVVQENVLKRLAGGIATVCKRDNGSFCRDTFMNACGLGD